jgi:competence protein ComEC
LSGRITLLNVGQGDSIILHQPETATAAVIDCAVPGAQQARDYLREEAVEHVVGVVVTHLDDDHYGGIPQLMSDMRPRPEMVAYSLVKGYRKAHPQIDSFLVQMDSYMRRYGHSYLRPEAGQHLGDRARGVLLEFLGPDSDEERKAARYNNANFASAIIRATVGDLTVILPGDAPPWRWGRLCHECPSALDADVLVLPHHGAAHVDSKVSLDDLLSVVNPAVVAVSVGSRNRYGHPRPATLEKVRQWVLKNEARLICTQLNECCATGASQNGGAPAPSGRWCAGRITVEHGVEGPTVIPERPAHRTWVEGLSAPRCSPVPAQAP